jgi:hypothetical protein
MAVDSKGSEVQEGQVVLVKAIVVSVTPNSNELTCQVQGPNAGMRQMVYVDSREVEIMEATARSPRKTRQQEVQEAAEEGYRSGTRIGQESKKPNTETK